MKIVTFGDSLTVGFQSPTAEHPTGETTPYGGFLQAWLGASAEVLVRGVNGELTGEMAMRLGRDVIDIGPDYVVILGGANDLGWGAQPPAIMRNLVTMYERCRAAKIQPIAVTVPSIRGADSLIPVRLALNRLILDYCRTRPQPIVDLFAATAEPDTLRLAEPYSNDGLHLTTAGYRLLAEWLYRDVLAARLP
jgi:lysophospholipase L1-like esterase